MHDQESEGLFDPQKGLPETDAQGGGAVGGGNERETPTVSEGDSPNHGSVDGPLAPEPLPTTRGGAESEMRPKENDARTSDGVETFKRMEIEAEQRGQPA